MPSSIFFLKKLIFFADGDSGMVEFSSFSVGSFLINEHDEDGVNVIVVVVAAAAAVVVDDDNDNNDEDEAGIAF